MRWIIAYDIRSDSQRGKLSRRLESVGFRRQKSVFEGTLPIKELHQLFAKLAEFVDPVTDQLTAWPMDAARHDLLCHCGRPRVQTEHDWLIL